MPEEWRRDYYNFKHFVVDGRDGYVELIARQFKWREWIWDSYRRELAPSKGPVVGEGSVVEVDGTEFPWRFEERLIVMTGSCSGPQLHVERGWLEWLENREICVDSNKITARFATAAVNFAISQGWPSRQGNCAMRIAYQENGFRQVT